MFVVQAERHREVLIPDAAHSHSLKVAQALQFFIVRTSVLSLTFDGAPLSPLSKVCERYRWSASRGQYDCRGRAGVWPFSGHLRVT